MTTTKKRNNESEVKARIAGDLKNHVVTVLKSDGLYRHWRCSKPNDCNMSFDVITWPGFLCYVGDMGEYLFSREADMIPWMRGSCMSYSYAAEKCVAHDGRLKEFSEERFEEVLQERIQEAEEYGGTYTVHRLSGKQEESVAEAIQEIRDAYNIYSMSSDAVKAMYESCLWDGGDLPSCEEYTYHFLWCLHALKWFCKQIETK